VLRWLKEEFELPAIRFEVVEQIGVDDLGELDEVDGTLVIRLSAKTCRSVNTAIETTIHEAAHAQLERVGVGHFHGPAFHRVHGQMQDAFDHHGHADSRAYSCEF
jgi:hypothetical protein